MINKDKNHGSWYKQNGNRKIKDHKIVDVVTFSLPSFFNLRVIIPPIELLIFSKTYQTEQDMEPLKKVIEAS